tara:strand:+ start:42 stop:1049 length:1008 start_codon:yes stop_codon:yes gene_type:complete
MAFSPFMQSSEAQNIIKNYLGGGYAASPNVNKAGVYRNPIFDLRTEQEKAGTLDPKALYPNPQLDFSVQEEVVDPCPPGYQLIDGVCQPIEDFGKRDLGGEKDDPEEEETLTFSEQEYNRMKKDPNNPFGAGIELDKWEVDEDEFGNTVYKYKKRGFTPTLFGIFDNLSGGNKRRKARFNEAIQTILGQTTSPNFFGQNINPLAFGYQDGDSFTMYSPENYLAQVSDVSIPGSNQGATMSELLGSVGQGTQGSGQGYQAPTQQVNTGQGGTQVSQNLGSLLQDSGKRDDNAYQAAIAKNIARNLADRDSTTGEKKSTASTGSKFSKSLGGFYGGR